MYPLASELAPLVCGLLLALTGAGKLFGRQTEQLAANTVLVRVFNDGRRATLVLRTVGAVELVVAAGLLAVPTVTAPGVAAMVLGVGFTGYLAYAKATAPESSCGCSARAEGPIGVRSFVRAGLVVVGGLLAVTARSAWWSRIAEQPLGAAGLLVVTAALLLVVSSDLDHLWLVPLRKARIRVFGSPLAAHTGELVPVQASVQLLENSLAWESARPVVRSALLDHWDEDGWRVLRYAGTYLDEDGAHPLSVLFALDPRASKDTAPNPAVRVSLVDEEREEILPSALLASVSRRPALPLAD